MTLSSRLVSFVAATAITAVTFAGPSFAAPNLASEPTVRSTIVR